ncbi:hypothetical protein BDZ89DRAFT_1073266 [Hymenopellis radicata]|nr:hypothetical protein BDZ89DRAFT_1073266 [Hymenopellis radicata]
MLADFIVFLATATPALSATLLIAGWICSGIRPWICSGAARATLDQHRYGFGRVNATHVRTDIKRSGVALNTRTSCSAPVGSTN